MEIYGYLLTDKFLRDIIRNRCSATSVFYKEGCKMPRSFMFKKEDIIGAAVEIVRKSGISALTARQLANALGSSSKPIFGLFENMQAVKRAVIEEANEVYLSYLKAEAENKKYPPYKSSGMGYIRFARNEPELFKLLFMRDRTDEAKEQTSEEIKPIISLICKNLNLNEEKAYLFHIEMWVYVHGIASMIATKYLDWDEDFVSLALTDMYEGLKFRYKGEETV